MTRLIEKDIERVVQSLHRLDQDLQDCCGKNLLQIAAFASGVDLSNVHHKKIGIVTITSGQGVIGGFSQTLAGILLHLGASVKIAAHTDVNGFYECTLHDEGVLMADDDRFMAMRFADGKISDNGEATGRGFAAALSLMAGDLTGKEVLIAGAGPVGRSAAAFLTEFGADVLLYDQNPDQLARLPWRTTDTIVGRKFHLILEATTSADVITEDIVTEDVKIAAPGMPLGIEKKLAQRLYQTHQLVHNPLELGTAVMYTDLLL